jgi:predicted lipoprotein
MKRHLVLTAAFALAIVVACSRKGDEGSADGPNAGTFDKQALLRAFATCALRSYDDFAKASTDLESTTKRAAETPSPDALAAARDAWKKAVDIWQRAEVLQYGPAAMIGPGALDMRDGAYSWPLVSRCLIDGQIVAKTYESSLSTALASTRGLAATEYLLFYEGADNGRGPAVNINTQGPWAALGNGEVEKRKLAYAHAAARDLAGRAAELRDAWDPAKGNFVATLSEAPNNTFPSQQMAFNAVSDAAYYVDDFVKTMKLRKPAELTPDCTAPPCLDLVESPWAKRSKEHLRNNLAGFEALLRGCAEGERGSGSTICSSPSVRRRRRTSSSPRSTRPRRRSMGSVSRPSRMT